MDYCACENSSCPMRKECWLYMFTRSEYQCFTRFEPNTDGTCDHFIDIKNVNHRLRVLKDGE